jgi:hypothetical protein
VAFGAVAVKGFARSKAVAVYCHLGRAPLHILNLCGRVLVVVVGQDQLPQGCRVDRREGLRRQVLQEPGQLQSPQLLRLAQELLQGAGGELGAAALVDGGGQLAGDNKSSSLCCCCCCVAPTHGGSVLTFDLCHVHSPLGKIRPVEHLDSVGTSCWCWTCC